MVACAGLALSSVLPAPAAALPAIPEKPRLERYESVPAPWRDYLLQARDAERIDDPLQRCLAFPDLPGNQWPEGHARAHCLIHHEAGIPTLAGIGEGLDRGEIAQLEASMQRLLDRHYSQADYSEAIHEVFNYRFDGGEASDQVSAKWLSLSPGSAFARLARASHLASAAIKARGDAFMADTPKENVRRMSALADQAVSLYREAIRIDPRLIAAHTGLLQIAMFDSRDDLESRAFADANALDPACAELANVRMRSLLPRWGGSYEQMLAYANALSAHAGRRPHLATHMARPYADRGSVLLGAGQYNAEAADVLDIAVRTGTDEDGMLSASDAARRTGRDDYRSLALLLQASRFKPLGTDAAVILSFYLVRIEPEISLRYALLALEQAPDDALAHYLAGAGYNNTKAYEPADRHYRIAIEVPERRQDSLREVADMWLFGSVPSGGRASKADLARARPYIDRLIAEYPDDGRGWLLQWYAKAFSDSGATAEGASAVLLKVDRRDPWQAGRAAFLEAVAKNQKTGAVFLGSPRK